ncbi:MAG: transposase [Saprospiraceae bacterium]|nr:transposase [Saprospiraceae bacterium]MBK7810296.1 transposase [Saprospiraceae bacterium]MBK9629899.1 transposase [Saprospiraceae bacterium]
MEKYKNKYRIPSTRLQNWDYRWAGSYFITICTQNRVHYFGEIANGQMQLSHVGIIANILWYQIPYHSNNVELGAFVVMPNHIHGILIINDNLVNTIETGHTVETEHALSLRYALSLQTFNETLTETSEQAIIIGQPRFQNIGKNSISSIVGSYKSAVTKYANRLGFDFHWQNLFHDHIIRDDISFQTISDYIINNPNNWVEDKFFNQE